MGSPPKDPSRPELGGVDPAELQAYFIKSGRYTAGVATKYTPTTPLTAAATHQNLAAGYPVGMRFHSAPVVRVADGKPMQLGHAAKADGAWRIYAFADASGERMAALVDFLGQSPQSPLKRFTPASAAADSVISLLAVYPQGHRSIAVDALPLVLLPRKGPFALVDYEKVYAADAKNDIFTLRSIDRPRGALVIVRPDQYVANVLPLDAQGELSAFFARFLLDC
jgi:phenol 2-monooxygenase